MTSAGSDLVGARRRRHEGAGLEPDGRKVELLKLADRLDALKRTIEADGKWYVSKGVSGPVALLPGDLTTSRW